MVVSQSPTNQVRRALFNVPLPCGPQSSRVIFKNPHNDCWHPADLRYGHSMACLCQARRLHLKNFVPRQFLATGVRFIRRHRPVYAPQNPVQVAERTARSAEVQIVPEPPKRLPRTSPEIILRHTGGQTSGPCVRPSVGRPNWATNWCPCPMPGTAPRTHLPARQSPRDNVG